uniref:Malonyl-CoA decarboxylase n=1 Tax=Parascaris univalens TaxID=6257 RepID=A0A915B0S9_PARUN
MQWIRGGRKALLGFIVKRYECGSSIMLRRSITSEMKIKEISRILYKIFSSLQLHRESSSSQLIAVATQMSQIYSKSTMDERRIFLREMCTEYGVDHDALKLAIDAYRKDHSTYRDLNIASRTRYFRFLQAIGNVEYGVKCICDIRADVLDFLSTSDLTRLEMNAMQKLEKELRELLTLWFCLSNLQLFRLTWQSPADIVEKVAQSDIVHPVKDLLDMRRRVGAHRRCFLFMHEAMPREPLVVIHVALMNKIADSIQDIIEVDRLDSCESINDTAIYYSISSTQPGLRGIDLGNLLIKRVVSELQQTAPQISIHSTLSPLPHFRSWLLNGLNDPSTAEKLFDERLIKLLLMDCKGFDNGKMIEDMRLSLLQQIQKNDFQRYDEIKPVILHLAARYLCEAKQPSSGRAIDPVANFHLRNGAEIYRLNWRGNTSVRGMRSSLGLMVNYRYQMEHVSENSAQYVNNKYIAVNDRVKSILQPL